MTGWAWDKLVKPAKAKAILNAQIQRPRVLSVVILVCCFLGWGEETAVWKSTVGFKI
jgi:hypothetical protein